MPKSSVRRLAVETWVYSFTAARHQAACASASKQTTGAACAPWPLALLPHDVTPQTPPVARSKYVDIHIYDCRQLADWSELKRCNFPGVFACLFPLVLMSCSRSPLHLTSLCRNTHRISTLFSFCVTNMSQCTKHWEKVSVLVFVTVAKV